MKKHFLDNPCAHCYVDEINDGTCKPYWSNTNECVDQAETKYCSSFSTRYRKCVCRFIY